MKLIIILISFTFITNGCSQENLSIEYIASTRGFYQQIKIENQTVAIKRNRNDDLKSKKCSNQEWSNLIEVFKTIDIENLPNINPPSKEHQFDGAAMAVLTVTKNNKVYETESFDHGNAPKEIDSLVKEILSIAENIE